MLGEKIAYAIVSSHLKMLSDIQVQCYPPLRQLHSDFGDFNNEVCHVMKMTIAENNLDMVLLQQQTFCFSSNVLGRANKLSIMTLIITI